MRVQARDFRIASGPGERLRRPKSLEFGESSAGATCLGQTSSRDLAPSFKKRGDACCRACLKQLYGSAARDKKAARIRKAKAAK